MLSDSSEGPTTPPGAPAGFSAIYEELRGLARQRLLQGLAGQSLQATALVHEVWLKMAASGSELTADPRHFYATAAQAMRWILVDHARKKSSLKRGAASVEADPEQLPQAAADERAEGLLALDAALERLERADARKHQVVMLRHYAGLSVEETARTLELSPATVKREWQFARAWLVREMGTPRESPDS